MKDKDMGEAEEDLGEKRRRQLPEISEKVWDTVNKIRKKSENTWSDLFERFYNYQEWFDHLLALPKKPTLGDKLNTVTVTTYMPLWLENLYYNFLEPTVGELHDIKEIVGKAKDKPAIVIGAGPSLFKYNHLEMLAKSRFYKDKIGPIVINSHVVKPCLEAGIIPDYMILLDPEPVMITHIDYEIVDKYAHQITGVFPITVHHEVLKRWKGKRIFFNAAISEATIPNVRAILAGLFPNISEMNALANAGSFSWNVARHLGASPIVLIGMDQGFLPETPAEETPYYDAFKKSYKTRDEILDNCYYFHTHSFFKTNSFTDEIYHNFMKNTIAIAKLAKEEEGITTINATGGGFIDAPDIIENQWFEDFLEKWEEEEGKKNG